MADNTPNTSTLPAWEARRNYAPAPTDVGLGKRWGMFYDDYKLDDLESNWDKSFPFQLLVLAEKEAGRFEVASVEEQGAMKYTLPIPPQSLNISMPFAIDGYVTLDGYVENHGGAPLRIISFSGTTGVMPTRGGAETAKTATVGQAIFAGTLQAASNLGTAVASISGETEAKLNVYEQDRFGEGDDPNIMLARGTGFYQFLLLQRFLEAYAEMKKSRQGRTLRLALAIWKDEAIYLCKPTMFTLRRSAESPLERRYDFQLEAYGRISPRQLNVGSGESRISTVSRRDPNALADIMNKGKAVRKSLQAGTALIRALGSDIETVVFGTLREIAFACKDALGVGLTLLDLPHALIQDFKSSVITQYQEVYATALKFKSQAENQSAQFREDLALLEDAAAENNPTGVLSSGHPVHSIFEDAEEHAEILDALDVGAITISDAVQSKLDAERGRVRSLARRDFEERRDALVKASADYADAIGAGSGTYNSLYGHNTAQTARRTPTDADFDVLFQLNEAAIQTARLAAYSDLTTPTVTQVEVIAGYAAKSGIDFRVPQSKLAVPFLYGHSLEDMASLYLGNPDRWIEIAALNGLHEPYVDEEGFTLPLLVNASGNTVLVADGSNLYLSQPVWLESASTPRQKRHVVSVTKISSSIYSVVLDGDRVDQFTLAGKSLLRAFLPHTVNSQMLVFIPSDAPAQDDPRAKPIPGVTDFDHLLAVGAIDLLLTPKRDLVITPDGDGRWAFGFTNIIQQAGIILNTPKGYLKRHPGFGFAISVGDTSVTAKDILKAAREAFTQDPTFTGVTAATVQRTGPKADVSLVVGIAGTNQRVPLTVTLDQ
jgi:hypothetical protein